MPPRSVSGRAAPVGARRRSDCGSRTRSLRARRARRDGRDSRPPRSSVPRCGDCTPPIHLRPRAARRAAHSMTRPGPRAPRPIARVVYDPSWFSSFGGARRLEHEATTRPCVSAVVASANPICKDARRFREPGAGVGRAQGAPPALRCDTRGRAQPFVNEVHEHADPRHVAQVRVREDPNFRV